MGSILPERHDAVCGVGLDVDVELGAHAFAGLHVEDTLLAVDAHSVRLQLHADAATEAAHCHGVEVGAVLDLVDHFDLFAGFSCVVSEHVEVQNCAVALHNEKAASSVAVGFQAAVDCVELLGQLDRDAVVLPAAQGCDGRRLELELQAFGHFFSRRLELGDCEGVAPSLLSADDLKSQRAGRGRAVAPCVSALVDRVGVVGLAVDDVLDFGGVVHRVDDAVDDVDVGELHRSLSREAAGDDRERDAVLDLSDRCGQHVTGQRGAFDVEAAVCLDQMAAVCQPGDVLGETSAGRCDSVLGVDVAVHFDDDLLGAGAGRCQVHGQGAAVLHGLLEVPRQRQRLACDVAGTGRGCAVAVGQDELDCVGAGAQVLEHVESVRALLDREAALQGSVDVDLQRAVAGYDFRLSVEREEVEGQERRACCLRDGEAGGRSHRKGELRAGRCAASATSHEEGIEAVDVEAFLSQMQVPVVVNVAAVEGEAAAGCHGDHFLGAVPEGDADAFRILRHVLDHVGVHFRQLVHAEEVLAESEDLRDRLGQHCDRDAASRLDRILSAFRYFGLCGDHMGRCEFYLFGRLQFCDFFQCHVITSL